MATPRSYTLAEVAKHRSVEDCWVVVKGKVYDASSFVGEHPGGQQLLVSHAGKDVTKEFVSSHYSDEAWSELAKLQVGELAAGAGAHELPAAEPAFAEFEVAAKERVGSAILLHLRVSGRARQKCVPSYLRTLSKFLNLFSASLTGALDALALWADAPVLGQHVTIKATVGGSDVVRQYTPIKQLEDGFILLVKVYRPCARFPAGGKMSQALDRLEVGDSVQVQGPSGHVLYQVPGGALTVYGEHKRAKTVAFICGGTGITPAYQIFSTALQDAADSTKFLLLYANSRAEDILLRSETDALAAAHPDRFTRVYTVSERPKGDWPFRVGRVDLAMIQDLLPHGGDMDCFVAMCGPPAMIDAACMNLTKHGYSGASYACF